MASDQSNIVDYLEPLPELDTHTSNDSTLEVWTDQVSVEKADKTGRWIITDTIAPIDGRHR